MHGLHNLARPEAEWLKMLGRGRATKITDTTGMPARIVEALAAKGLLTARAGFVKITTKGMAEALRLSTPEMPAPRLHPFPSPHL